MYKHTFSIGLNDKNTLKQELSDSQAIEIISSHMGDCTIKQGSIGVYTMDNGQKVIEKSLIVDKFGGSKKEALNIARALCKALNQESIILETTQSKGQFIRE